MWILLFISSGIACAIYSKRAIEDFLNNDYLTVIKTINEQESDFPTVSFCNYANKTFKFEVLDFMFNKNKLTNEWKDYIQKYNDLDYGDCYRINSGKNFWSNYTTDIMKSSTGGMFYGLNLDLYVETQTDIGEFKVYIHNYSNTPTSLFNKGYLISSGCYNYFQVERYIEYRLEEPYNPCLKDVSKFPSNKTIIGFIRDKNLIYTQNECIRLCTNLNYTQTSNCNCSLKSNDDILSVECSYSKKNTFEANCTDAFIENFQKNNPSKICSKYCPLECDSSEFDKKSYSRELPRVGSISKSFDYPAFKTYANVSKSFFSIYVFYEDLKYTLIEQNPKMQTFDLISNVGGLFGLFLGMGLLSFIEIFEIIAEAFFILLKD